MTFPVKVRVFGDGLSSSQTICVFAEDNGRDLAKLWENRISTREGNLLLTFFLGNTISCARTIKEKIL